MLSCQQMQQQQPTAAAVTAPTSQQCIALPQKFRGVN